MRYLIFAVILLSGCFPTHFPTRSATVTSVTTVMRGNGFRQFAELRDSSMARCRWFAGDGQTPAVGQVVYCDWVPLDTIKTRGY